MTERELARRRWLAYVPLAVALAVYLGLTIAVARSGSPLGHDEAVYSLRARDFLSGRDPLFYWAPYRAPGLPLVLQVAWLGNGTEPYLRMVTAGFGLLLVGSTWFVARRFFGDVAAGIAAVGLALTPLAVRVGTQVWPDIPGAALGMATVAVYVHFLDRERVSRWVLVVPIVAFAATMTRFGAPMTVGIALVGVTIWRFRAAWASRYLIVATGALTMLAMYSVLAVTAVTAWAQGDNPVAPSQVPNRLLSNPAFPHWGSFGGYVRLGPSLIKGVVPMMMILGLLLSLVAVRHRRWRPGVLTALGVGLFTFVGISITLHAEARYLSPALPWAWIAASAGLATAGSYVATRLSVRQWRDGVRVTLLAVVTPLLGVLLVWSTYSESFIAVDFSRGAYAAIKQASKEIDRATVDQACGVVSSYVPQVSWYSNCPTRTFDLEKVVVDSPGFGDGPRFVVFVEKGKRQPQGDLADAYRAASPGEPWTTSGVPGAGRGRYVEVRLVPQPR